MSPARTFATARRVLTQLRHDKRTLLLALLVPSLLLILLRLVFYDNLIQFSAITPMMLGIFPLVMMFLITSISTLRERTSGTLDRLLTQPISKLDFMFGYALAFTVLGAIQAGLACLVSFTLLDINVAGGYLPVIVIAIAAAFLGTTLGLLVSAFATSEFQAVQLVMPIMIPQILTCGLFSPREHMAPFLQFFAGIMPLSYSVDAMKQATQSITWSNTLTLDIVIVLAFGIAALVLGAVTIQRQE